MAVKLTTLPEAVVTTAGTRVQVSAQKIMVNAVIIQAHESNKNNIFIGDSNVSSSQATAALGPGEPFEFSGHPQMRLLSELLLSDIYIDSVRDGDKVRVSYVKRKPFDAFSG